MLPSAAFRYASFSFSSDGVDEISFPNNNNPTTNNSNAPIIPPVVSSSSNQQQQQYQQQLLFNHQTSSSSHLLPLVASVSCQQQQQVVSSSTSTFDDGGVFLTSPVSSFSQLQLLPQHHPASFFDLGHCFHPGQPILPTSVITGASSSTSSTSSVSSAFNTTNFSASTPPTQTTPANKSNKGQNCEKTSATTHQVRKERSRKAARNRRGRENKEFQQLANLLPFEQGISSQLDKASVVRLVISYLRLRAQTPYIFTTPPSSPLTGPPYCVNGVSSRPIVPKCESSSLSTVDYVYEKCHGVRIQEALEGFMLVFEIARPGRILYVSQTVANFTGLALVDLIGRSIYDYLHPDDAEEIRQQLETMCSSSLFSNNSYKQFVPLLPSLPPPQLSCYNNNNNSEDDDNDDGEEEDSSGSSSSAPSSSKSTPRLSAEKLINDFATVPVTFHARFRCTANKRGTFFKVPGYRLFSLVGRLCQGALPSDSQFVLRRPSESNDTGVCLGSGLISSFHFIGTALALPSVSISEYNLSPDQIVFKLDNYLNIIDYDANNNTINETGNNQQTSWFSTSFLPRNDANNNTTLFDICHPSDANRVKEAYRIFLTKNQAMIPCLRICSDRESFFGDLWLAGVQSCNNLPPQVVSSNVVKQQQQSPASVGSSLIAVPVNNNQQQQQQPTDNNGVSIIAIFTPLSRDSRLFSALSTRTSRLMMTADSSNNNNNNNCSDLPPSSVPDQSTGVIFENGPPKKRRLTAAAAFENSSNNNFLNNFLSMEPLHHHQQPQLLIHQGQLGSAYDQFAQTNHHHHPYQQLLTAAPPIDNNNNNNNNDNNTNNNFAFSDISQNNYQQLLIPASNLPPPPPTSASAIISGPIIVENTTSNNLSSQQSTFIPTIHYCL